jgi:hypothetical protein
LILLATAKGWRTERRQVEALALGVSLTVAVVLMGRAPLPLQIGLTPLVMMAIVLGVLGFSEWQFAPDWGQKGMSWFIVEAVRGAMWAGLGLAIAMLGLALTQALAWTSSAHTWINVLLYGVGAFAGRTLDLLVHPRPNRSLAALREGDPPRSVRNPGAGQDAADWWKLGPG